MQPKKKHHKAPPAKPKKIVEKRKMPEPSAKPEPIKIRPKKHLFLDLDETLMCGLANTNTTLPKLKTKVRKNHSISTNLLSSLIFRAKRPYSTT